MTAGRKPKPTALKLIDGNPGKRKIVRDDEAKLPAACPDAPKFLCVEAKTEWRRVVKTLHAVGLMTEVDRAALAAYCQAFGVWADAESAMRQQAVESESGQALVVLTKNGHTIQNPLLGIANKAREDVVKFAAEFGMTPSARSRVKAAPPDGDEKDPAREFFG